MYSSQVYSGSLTDQVEDKLVCQEESAESRNRNGWRILRERAPDRAIKEVVDTVSTMQKAPVKSA